MVSNQHKWDIIRSKIDVEKDLLPTTLVHPLYFRKQRFRYCSEAGSFEKISRVHWEKLYIWKYAL